MTQLEKHEKAIRLLDNITYCERRIDWLSHDIKTFPKELSKYPKKRLGITLKVKEKLQNYYDKNFKL